MTGEAGTTLVIVGGGQAAGAAIRRLREAAYAGTMVLVTDEPALPYERPGLSKEYLLRQAPAPRAIISELLPNERFLAGRSAVALDLAARRVRLDQGEVGYDRLLLATGARPRTLDVAGATLQGVGYLRTQEDAQRLADTLDACAAQGGRLLVVGGSWIGLEVAAAARQRGIAVLLVERGDRLCARTLPPGIAERLRALHTANGVELRFGASVTAFRGSARVTHAALSDGSEVAIGAAVIGIGVVPNLELAQRSGLRTRNGIVTDGHGRTSDPFVYAAGDVAEAECGWQGRPVRYETWSSANAQGAQAVDSMLRDLSRPGLSAAGPLPVPWFWSDQYGRTLQVLGNPLLADSAALVKDDEHGFVESFSAGSRIVGAAAIGHPRDLRALRARIAPASPFQPRRNLP